MWFGDLVTMRWWDDLWLNESFAEYMAYRTRRRGHRVHRRLGRVRRRPQDVGVRRGAGSQHPPGRGVAGSRRPVGARQLRRHLVRQGRLGDPPAHRAHRRRGVRGRGRRAPALARVRQRRPRASSSRRWSGVAAAPWRRGARPGWRRPAPTGSPSTTACSPARLRRPTRPTARTPSTSRPSPAAARWPGSTSSSRASARPCRGWTTCPPARSSCRTPATSPGRRSRSTPRRVAALPAGLADVPDAQAARGALGRAARGGPPRRGRPPRRRSTCSRGAWPRETSAAVLARAALVMTAGSCRCSSRRRSRRPRWPGSPRPPTPCSSAPPPSAGPAGDALAVVAARVWAGPRLRHRPAAALGGRRRHPAVLAGDDDFRWAVLRRLAALGAPGRRRDRGGRGRRPLPGRLAGGARRAGRAADRRGQGVGLGDAARRRRAVELRGARPGRRVLGRRPTPTSCGPTSTGSVTSSWACRRGWATTRCPGSSPPSTPPGWSTTRPPRRPRRLLGARRPHARGAAGARGCRPRAARGARQPRRFG